jgi:hypothetical protein
MEFVSDEESVEVKDNSVSAHNMTSQSQRKQLLALLAPCVPLNEADVNINYTFHI